MRNRASVLMPAMAIFTVLGIVSVGWALGTRGHGIAWSAVLAARNVAASSAVPGLIASSTPPVASSDVTTPAVAPAAPAGEAVPATEEGTRPAVRDISPEADDALVVCEPEPVSAEPQPEQTSDPLVPPDADQDVQEPSNQPIPSADPVLAEGTQTEEVARSDHDRYRFSAGEDQDENEASASFDRREGEA